MEITTQDQTQRIPSSVYMPWLEIFEAFIEDAPRRLNIVSQGIFSDPIQELKELRLLTIGGSRQSGKTQACIKLIQNKENIAFTTSSFYINYFKRQLGRHFSKFVSLGVQQFHDNSSRHYSKKEDFKGVKLFILDDVSDNAIISLEHLYLNHTDWFDPEFMVIHIL